MHHRDVQSPSGTVRAGEEDISSLLTLSQLNFLFYGTVPAKRLGKLSPQITKAMVTCLNWLSAAVLVVAAPFIKQGPARRVGGGRYISTWVCNMKQWQVQPGPHGGFECPFVYVHMCAFLVRLRRMCERAYGRVDGQAGTAYVPLRVRACYCALFFLCFFRGFGGGGGFGFGGMPCCYVTVCVSMCVCVFACFFVCPRACVHAWLCTCDIVCVIV